MGGGTGIRGLLEREGELAAFGAALGQATKGDGTTLAWFGPAGVGKSALVARALEDARGAGAATLHVRACEMERDLAFGVVRQLLSPRLLAAGPEERERLFDGAADLARPVFGMSTAPPPSDPAAATLHGLHWLCANLAHEGPLVLALDDLHWADPASLRFAAYLARRLEGLPILLLLAARPSEPGAERLLLDQLLADEAVDVHELRPLSEAACAELVRARLGETAADRLCAACSEASGGNPFLLGELLEALAREGIDPATAGAATIREIGPESVSREILGRLRRLDAAANALARSLAVHDAGAGFRELAVLAGLDEASAAGAADALADAAILAPGRPLAFLHPLIRTAVYGSMAAGERARLHARAADVLRAVAAPVAARATHLLSADPAGRPEAFADLMEAGGEALAVGAPEAAIRYLDRAHEELPEGADPFGLFHLRGLAKLLVGDPGTFDDLRAAADAAGDPVGRATVLRELARALTFTHRQLQALDVLDEARAGLGDAHQTLALELRAEGHWIAWSSHAAAPRFAAEVDAPLLPEVGDPLTRSVVLGFQGWRAVTACRPRDEGLALLDASREGGHLVRAGFAGMPAVCVSSLARAHAGDPLGALADLEANRESSRAEGGLFGVLGTQMISGAVNLMAGRLDEAQADGEVGLVLCDQVIGGEESRVPFLAVLGAVALARGEPEAGLAHVSGVEAPETWMGLWLRAARGQLLLVSGDAAGAAEELDRVARDAAAQGCVLPDYPFGFGAAHVAATARNGRVEEARALADQALARARALGAPMALAVALIGATAVRPADAVELAGEAVEVTADSPFPLIHARALGVLGGALLHAGRRVDAREPLREALDLSTRLGAGVMAAQIRADLVAAGARPRRAALRGADALTPAERRVATLAAAGATNREIAQELFVTVRTVEMHVSAALTKLGVSSRRELGAALAAQV